MNFCGILADKSNPQPLRSRHECQHRRELTCLGMPYTLGQGRCKECAGNTHGATLWIRQAKNSQAARILFFASSWLWPFLTSDFFCIRTQRTRHTGREQTGTCGPIKPWQPDSCNKKIGPFGCIVRDGETAPDPQPHNTFRKCAARSTGLLQMVVIQRSWLLHASRDIQSSLKPAWGELCIVVVKFNLIAARQQRCFDELIGSNRKQKPQVLAIHLFFRNVQKRVPLQPWTQPHTFLSNNTHSLDAFFLDFFCAYTVCIAFIAIRPWIVRR